MSRKIYWKMFSLSRSSSTGGARGLRFSVLLVALVATAQLAAQTAVLHPVRLTTAHRPDPVGIDPANLVFAWQLEAEPLQARAVRQTAYRILVATSTKSLDRNVGDVWDSGMTASSKFWELPYNGPTLHSHKEYFWKAQTWSHAGSSGPWSAAAHFTTGLLHVEDWTAKWISAPESEDKPALPLFRKDIQLRQKPTQALLSVSGLGQYEVRLNGRDVTNTVLNPAWTNYRKSAAYDTYDVIALLRSGANAFAALLGNGMYNVDQTPGRYTKFTGSFGPPKLILQLDVRYGDGTSQTFISDRSWKVRPGPITFSSIYGGEDYDAGALPADWAVSSYQEAAWKPAVEVSGPGGVLSSETSSPMVVAQKLSALSVTHPKAGLAVYDLGKNISGWPEIRVHGPAGSLVTMLPGELLAVDGTVSQQSTDAGPGRAVLYRYTLGADGLPEVWHPRFSYHSFRYVQVTVQPATAATELPEVLDLTGDFVHADVLQAGTFNSSDELFNRIHELIDRAVLSNLASVVTDCPSREKLGWLEQTYLNAGTLFLNYDVGGLYEKMSRDMREAQLPNGVMPSIAPELVAFVDGNGHNTAFRDSPEWGSAIILSPWALFQYTGDRRPLEDSYEAMKKYADYLESRTRDGLLDYGLGDWYDIGPKAPGPSQLTSRTVTATGVYYEDLVTLAKIARLLRRPGEAKIYETRAARELKAYNQALFHQETGQYDRGSQTANALPLALGMVSPDRIHDVLEHLVADIHAHGDHVTAGDVGFHYVVRALTQYGRSDVLAAMFSRRDSPSYGYQLEKGATTLTEAWDANPKSSQNHFMLGHGEEWFYRGLAGLTFDMSLDPGNAILLRPSFLAGVNSASATHRSPMGDIALSWKKDGARATVDVSVPVGAQARLLLPAKDLWTEGRKDVAGAPGVIKSEKKDGEWTIDLGSGHYHFASDSLSQ